jgi:Protein of unknown function (DUF3618)
MSQTPDQIESDISNTRAELHSNLQELENRVKSVTDWRQLFANNPVALSATAFGVGALVARMTVSRNRSRASVKQVTAPQNGSAMSPKPRGHALKSLDIIRDAVVGLAATKITAFLDEAIPGFHAERRKAKPDDSQSELDAAAHRSLM